MQHLRVANGTEREVLPMHDGYKRMLLASHTINKIPSSIL